MRISEHLYYYEHFINYSELDEVNKLVKTAKREKNEIQNSYGASYSYSLGLKSNNSLIFSLYNRLKGIIEAQFSCRVNDESFHIILDWVPGDSLPEHVDRRDNEPPVPTPSGNPSRDISSTIYINSDYDGGLISFPNQNIKMKPNSGSLLLFESGPNYPHSVSDIVSGNRWTITNFWSMV